MYTYSVGVNRQKFTESVGEYFEFDLLTLCSAAVRLVNNTEYLFEPGAVTFLDESNKFVGETRMPILSHGDTVSFLSSL